MKTLKNTAEMLNSFCKIGFGICVSIAILLAIIAIVIALGGESIITEDGFATLTLGNVDFEISHEYFPDLSFSKTLFFLTFGLASVSVVVGAFFLKFVQKIFKPLIEENPFDGTVSKNITKLSNFVLIGGGIASVISTVGQALILKSFDLEKLFLNENIIGINIDNDLDLSFVWVFLIIRMLAIVFKYGEELQKESDETL